MMHTGLRYPSQKRDLDTVSGGQLAAGCLPLPPPTCGVPAHNPARDMSTKPPRIRFYPFAYALFTEELYNYCWYCLAPVESKKRCLGCGFALFCGKECQTLGWKDHKAECKGLKKSASIPDIEIRLLGRIVLRHKDICSGKDKKIEGFYKERSSKRTILEIWSHIDSIRKDQYAMKKFEDIYSKLTEFYESKFMLPKEEVFELHCRDYINRHALSDKAYLKEIGKGLYLDLCAYDHSCRPNTVYTCDGFIATLRALNSDVSIKDKTKTFYSYIDLLSSLQQRKKELKDTWYFDCRCERCTDPDDHILTSILCPVCPRDERETLYIFGERSHKDEDTAVITCPKCSNEVPKEYVLEAVSAMRFIDKLIEDKEIEQMPMKTRIEFLQDLLERFTKILSGTNIYLCKLIQNLIPLIPPDNNEVLLRLHKQAESCVRRCFPHNHPANAFHLRNIGIFLNNLKRYEEAVTYLREADQILEFTLDSDHTMTVENRELLKQTLLNMGAGEELRKYLEPSKKTFTEVKDSETNGKTEHVSDSAVHEEAKKGDLNKEVQIAISELVVEDKTPLKIASTKKNTLKKKFADLFSEDLSDLPDLIP
ncbi:unnamed protein product [Cylicocyclus nassatus]|uniref:MYND-type domain-containing protein n=1 Tax=Cylicocyclus nassatus TaxID=53992 RepID=A0AA36MHW2_CYLNA|nr:unnamed protein product [Cylicocyclus nassatus]